MRWLRDAASHAAGGQRTVAPSRLGELMSAAGYAQVRTVRTAGETHGDGLLPPTGPAPVTPPPVDVLVGRAEELAMVNDTLADAQRHALVIAGATGVGKTRLARESLALARQRGRAPFWVSASEAAATIPFGALAHLRPRGDSAEGFQMMSGAAGWLASAAQGQPAVLGVDDAHQLDDASAALVHHLAVTGAAFVVATVRSGAPVPGPITALWKDGLAERVELQPLGRSDTAALAESLLAGPIEGITREQLWRLSEGNPLYLCELIRGGFAAHALTSQAGVWCWQGRVSAAARLAELVAERVRRQPADVQRLIDLVAFGEPLALALLERAGMDAAAIERAERAGLVRTELSGHGITVRLAHPIFGEVARSGSSPLHRREVCRQLARAARLGENTGDLVRTAVWHVEGGVDPGAGVLAAAACRALAVPDLPLALRLSAAAVRAGEGQDAQRAAAMAHALCGDAERADAEFAGLDRQELPDLVRAELAASRAWNLTFGLGRPAAGDAVLAAAENAVSAGHELLACQRANFLTIAGRPAEALAVTASVIGRPGAPDEATGRALASRCQSLAVQGRHEESLVAGERALELHRLRHGGDWSMIQEEILAGLCLTHLHAGRLAEAQAVVEAGRARSTAAGWRVGTAMWATWQGNVMLARGAARSAAAQFREAAALISDSAHPYQEWVIRLLSVLHARAAALVGEVEEAVAAMAVAQRLAQPWTDVLDAWDGMSHSWLAAARGELSTAIELALAAAERARRYQQSGWEIIARHQVVRFGAAELVAARLAELGSCVDGPLPALFVRHGAALSRADGAGLDAVAAGFADLGYLLLAVDASAQAAHIHRANGRIGSATMAAARARELATHCESARTPALALLTDPTELTRRETELARLAASGLTNRTIAQRLAISVRTVDNTLHQVYTKLGVAGRNDLRLLLTPLSHEHSAAR
ncbi:MAG TPA: LuxR C-terminal-related transcriptional regulator [Pseudonocardiaceae bacterium]|nr:LuxR C-terminal-related transcriptional regulator [Pseudonocardiaceae bacterium]